MPLDGVIMDLIINVLFVINHIPCSNQIDGLLRMFLNLMSDSP